VTDLQVATVLAADLFEVPASDAPVRAVNLGTAVAQKYRSLATALASGGLTVVLDAPNREDPATLSPNKAERVADALKEVTQPRTFTEVVIGTLSIADATQKMFGLALDPGRRKPPSLRGKRLVRGRYTPAVEELMRDRGLWGRRVRATLEVKQDALISTSTIRPPEYRLIDVEEAVT
jgi:hypothetical protein